MLSSGAAANQYLRPEYLSPLPTTLDAKKSPLALLAQTCSQIGADSPNSKLLQNTEKSKSGKSDSSRDKTSPATLASSNDTPLKSSFKPYEASVSSREKTGSPEDRSSTSSNGSRVRTPVTAKTSASTPATRCASNQSAVSPPQPSPTVAERKTPAATPSAVADGTAKSDEPSTATKGSSDRNVNASPTSAAATATATSSSASKGTAASAVLTSAADLTVKDMPLGTFKPGAGIPVSSSAYIGVPYSASALPLPVDLMASSLMSHHALKSTSLGPYLSYARMKNPAGGDSLVPVCRDPYCTGCSLSSHLLGTTTTVAAKTSSTSSPCPAGCAQCDHAAGKPPGYLGHSSAAAAAYAHAQLAALAAASQLPYVCNWIAGDAAYCGKRFATSEELLQHLRTHTSLASVSESSAALSMLNAAPTLPPAHPLLHRTYPTPPLSPLATARYHPYSKPSLLPPSLAAASSLASFPLGHPGLSPYFSPYSLYGPRLGAASTMHP